MTKAAIQELDWEILPHPPYSPDLANRITTSLALSPTICAERSFLQQRRAELQNWLDEFFTAKPADFFKRGIENLPKR
jgi:hypothetical protein